VERAAAAGMEMLLIGPAGHLGSGLSRAILRGGRYVGADTLEELVLAVATAFRDGLSSVYAYHPFLDTTGHVKGVGSSEWLDHLSLVDRAVAAIAEGLPPGASLFVTADHGMVNLAPEEKVDVAEAPELLSGVRALAGEARARHVHCHAGSFDDVLATWRQRVGERMWIVPGEQAIDEGWFGPRVEDRVRPRIGDVVAASHGSVGVLQREVDPLQAMLVGHHGSMTSAEQLVPLLRIDR